MSYNVMEGGIRPTRERIQFIEKILSTSGASVIALQEITADDHTLLDLGILKRIFPFKSILSVNGEWTHGSSVALLSQSEIHVHRVGRRVRAQSTVLSTSQGDLKLVNLYLSHVDEATRTAEIAEVLSEFPPDKRTLLCGDFNALSPQDTAPLSVTADFTPRMREKYCRSGKLVFDTISSVIATGYVDVGLLFYHPSEITKKTKVTGVSPSKTPPVRIDYFFASPDLLRDISGISMIQTHTAMLASDHFPWVIDMLPLSVGGNPSDGNN